MRKCGTGAWIHRNALLALTITTIFAAGCGGGGGEAAGESETLSNAPPSSQSPDPVDGGTGSPSNPPDPANPDPASPDPVEPAPSENAAPTISADPTLQVNAGALYSFAPAAVDPDGDELAFSIQNRPEWAEFSTVTGELSGTPTTAGSYADITISVSDGQTSAALPPFTVTVSPVVADAADGVTLQWELSAETLVGTLLGELAGFRIHYGKRADVLSETIELQTPGLASYVIDGLPPGTYYFAIRAVTKSGTQSPLSNVIRKVVS